VLLYVEQEITAFTGRIEVLGVAQLLQVGARANEGLLAEAADIVRRALKPACGDELSCLDQMFAGNFAVEPESHEAAGL